MYERPGSAFTQRQTHARWDGPPESMPHNPICVWPTTLKARGWLAIPYAVDPHSCGAGRHPRHHYKRAHVDPGLALRMVAHVAFNGLPVQPGRAWRWAAETFVVGSHPRSNSDGLALYSG